MVFIVISIDRSKQCAQSIHKPVFTGNTLTIPTLSSADKRGTVLLAKSMTGLPIALRRNGEVSATKNALCSTGTVRAKGIETIATTAAGQQAATLIYICSAATCG